MIEFQQSVPQCCVNDEVEELQSGPTLVLLQNCDFQPILPRENAHLVEVSARRQCWLDEADVIVAAEDESDVDVEMFAAAVAAGPDVVEMDVAVAAVDDNL